jgi:hypothetical protein
VTSPGPGLGGGISTLGAAGGQGWGANATGGPSQAGPAGGWAAQGANGGAPSAWGQVPPASPGALLTSLSRASLRGYRPSLRLTLNLFGGWGREHHRTGPPPARRQRSRAHFSPSPHPTPNRRHGGGGCTPASPPVGFVVDGRLRPPGRPRAGPEPHRWHRPPSNAGGSGRRSRGGRRATPPRRKGGATPDSINSRTCAPSGRWEEQSPPHRQVRLVRGTMGIMGESRSSNGRDRGAMVDSLQRSSEICGACFGELVL